MSTGDCSSEVMVKNLTGGNFVLATEVLEMTHGCAESALGKKETKQYRFGLKSRKRIVFSPKRPKKIHLMKKDNSKKFRLATEACPGARRAGARRAEARRAGARSAAMAQL